MSSVTNVILVCHSRHDIAKLNTIIRPHQNGQVFVDPAQEVSLERWHGGNRRFETRVALCAFNYFDEEQFFGAVADMEWDETEKVQVFVKRPEDVAFSLYVLEGHQTPLTGTWVGTKTLTCKYEAPTVLEKRPAV